MPALPPATGRTTPFGSAGWQRSSSKLPPLHHPRATGRTMPTGSGRRCVTAISGGYRSKYRSPRALDDRPSKETAMSLSREFAAFVAGLGYEDLPPEVVDRAKGVTLQALSSALVAHD